MSVDAVRAVYQFPADEKHWQVERTVEALREEQVVNGVLDDIWAAVQDTEGPYACQTPELARDAFTLSLCAGLTNYECVEADDATLAQHRSNFSAFWAVRDQVLGRAGADHTTNEHTLTGADRFWYNLSLSCKGRCFFITEKGYYGLGPWIMKPGDECRLLNGANVPFVLRKEKTEPSLKVVGEAYLHGVMRGELFLKADTGEWVVTDLI